MIPGLLVSLATFPGVIVHEIAHQLFCRLAGVAVLDVCYFRVGNPAGYVIHEAPTRFHQNLLIGVGPFFVNSVLGPVIALPGAIPVLQFSTGSVLDYFLIWLGVSIAMHSFPSTGDAQSIWASVKAGNAPLALRALVAPVVVLIYAGAVGSVLWLDYAYGVALALWLPGLLARALA